MNKMIAHRGLVSGPSAELENHPNTIRAALNRNCDAEVDVWWDDNRWWLGHDAAQYEVDWNFIATPGLWLHCKNFAALSILRNTNLHYFWHQSDDYTITSRGFIWAYPGRAVDRNTVMVMPEWGDIREAKYAVCHAICSDEIDKLRVMGVY